MNASPAPVVSATGPAAAAAATTHAVPSVHTAPSAPSVTTTARPGRWSARAAATGSSLGAPRTSASSRLGSRTSRGTGEVEQSRGPERGEQRGRGRVERHRHAGGPGAGRAPRSRPPATGRRAAAGTPPGGGARRRRTRPRGGRSRDNAAFAPASGSIERSPSGATSTTQVPVGSALVGVATSRVDAVATATRSAAPRPASSSPARVDERHRRARDREPRGDVRLPRRPAACARAPAVSLPARERRGHARDDVDHEVAEDDDRPAAVGSLKTRLRAAAICSRQRGRCAARGARSRRGSRHRSRGGSGQGGTG